jgi:hypothetical protein
VPRVQDADDLESLVERLTGDEAFREVLRQPAFADVVENARLVRGRGACREALILVRAAAGPEELEANRRGTGVSNAAPVGNGRRWPFGLCMREPYSCSRLPASKWRALGARLGSGGWLSALSMSTLTFRWKSLMSLSFILALRASGWRSPPSARERRAR